MTTQTIEKNSSENAREKQEALSRLTKSTMLNNVSIATLLEQCEAIAEAIQTLSGGDCMNMDNIRALSGIVFGHLAEMNAVLSGADLETFEINLS